MPTLLRHLLGLLTVASWLALALPASAAPPRASAALEHFETRVRPLLAAKCWQCHGPQKQKGKLRLDSAAALTKGGESGPVLVPGKPDASLLIQAVRRTGDVKMPPDGKLTEREVADLAAWIRSGAVWPAGEPTPKSETPISTFLSMAPDDPSLHPYLQAWYKADVLPLQNGQPVHVWPDSSGHARDLSATAGVRRGGVGQPPRFVSHSALNRRPAVRFDIEHGLAASPDNPVDIHGNAAFTMVLLVHVKPNRTNRLDDGILGIGDPAPPGNPGRPLAALVQINRGSENHSLHLAGGWDHDATLGPGSFQQLYERPLLLTITKTPGPMCETTRFFINGLPAGEPPLRRQVQGSRGIPDIRHRSDIGLYLGKALDWSGSFRGEVAEAIVYNKALTDSERGALEAYLADRYSLLLPSMLAQAAAHFTSEQKAFWAFQPLKRSNLPRVKQSSWPTSPVDYFVLARLQEVGLSPSPPADKRTLLRRVTFDLTGLPPTPEEIVSFLADSSPQAFAKVVDRLLASPHYGERWGRHWLDVVRYADSTANDANAVMRYAFRYRDYVVQALNKDKPYDQFVMEQLAGDLLPPTADPKLKAERIIATGFLMVGPKALAETDKEQTLLDIADEQIDVTGRALLGLTIGCARCHDHKFDPIPTVDYYSLAGVFRSAEILADRVPNASMWNEFPLPQSSRAKPIMVMAAKEGVPVNLRVHLRGNRYNLGAITPRRFLQIIAGENQPPLPTTQSGRLELARWIASPDNPLTARVMVNRLWQGHFGTGLVATSDNFGSRGEAPSHPALLDWLAGCFIDSGWSIKSLHRHMVLSSTYQMASVSNAQAQQLDPNNRLLWRMPRRRLEAEALRDALLAVSGQLDRRLGGGEEIDPVIQTAESIDVKRGFFVPRVKSDDPCYNIRRRSIYLPVIRNALPDVLALFDAADANGVTAVRNDSTVPAQALFMLNNPLVVEQARLLARNLLAASKVSDVDRLHTAYAKVLGRSPAADELADALQFFQEYGMRAKTLGRLEIGSRLAAWQSFCQMLFCSNEFLYLD
jgi:cytochrome c553